MEKTLRIWLDELTRKQQPHRQYLSNTVESNHNIYKINRNIAKVNIQKSILSFGRGLLGTLSTIYMADIT